MNSSTNYKTTSDVSMLIGSSCSGQNLENQHQPKLENFLGRHSFGQHESAAYNNNGDYIFNNCSLQLPSEAANGVANSGGGGSGAAGGGDDGGGGGGGGSIHNNSSIGLSMIKTWLRNQPAPPPQQDIKNDGGATGGNNASLTSAQTLSLSMSTGSQSSSALPLLTACTAGGTGGETSSSDNKQQKTATGLDSQTGAIEAVPRKSIDTFGQRTSIYRGVTRCVTKFHRIFPISILCLLALPKKTFFFVLLFICMLIF